MLTSVVAALVVLAAYVSIFTGDRRKKDYGWKLLSVCLGITGENTTMQLIDADLYSHHAVSCDLYLFASHAQR